MCKNSIPRKQNFDRVSGHSTSKSQQNSTLCDLMTPPSAKSSRCVRQKRRQDLVKFAEKHGLHVSGFVLDVMSKVSTTTPASARKGLGRKIRKFKYQIGQIKLSQGYA